MLELAGNSQVGFLIISVRFKNVNDLELQSDGKILYASAGGYGRLNADGTLDSSFPNSTTEARALLVAGNTLYIAVQTPSVNSPRMRKFNLLTNAEDTVFAANFATHQASSFSSTSDLALLTDGKIAFAGTRNIWGIINSDGTLVSGFTNIFGDPNSGAPTRNIFGVTTAPGGKVYLSGDFTINSLSITTQKVARMNGNGTLDETFVSSFSSVATLALGKGIPDGDGVVFVGASLTANLVRFNPSGVSSFPATGSASTGISSIIKDSAGRAVFGVINSPLIRRVQLDTGDPFLILASLHSIQRPSSGNLFPLELAGLAWGQLPISGIRTTPQSLVLPPKVM